MRITFCGAAGTVTGSCYLIETGNYRFLVDCGMYQGGRAIRQLNREPFLFNPAQLDFVLLTHGHVDHAGLLPKLWQSGFRGEIHTTKATLDLSRIILLDAAHIQEMDAEWRLRKRKRSGDPLQTALYDVAAAEGCLKLFKPHNYQEPFAPRPGIQVNFADAGHILGSALIQLEVTEAKARTKLVFSGDLGQREQPIIQDPTYIDSTDYLVVESTYGNRLHEAASDRVELLRQIIMAAVASGGNLVIPAFAVGRTQDLLYHIKTLLNKKAIPALPVYIDSPMAVSVTQIYRDNPAYYDAPTRALFQANQSPFEFANLHFIQSTEESKSLNSKIGSAIIISASGMCEAGRILHHLKHNLWRPESHILFVGYQATETLGRRLLDGAKLVKIMGETIGVQAQIRSIGGFSAHADQKGLLDWLDKFKVKPRGAFVVHGESEVQQEFAGLVQNRFGWEVIVPAWGESFSLKARAQREKQPQPKPANKLILEQTATDLEHSILNLRQQIRQAKPGLAAAQVAELKQLLAKLEKELQAPD